MKIFLAVAFVVPLAFHANAQVKTTEFAGGTLQIESKNFESILRFNEREIGRDHFVTLDRIVSVAGTDVALISLAGGGNACEPDILLVWPDGAGSVKTKLEECSPPPAVSEDRIIFVPYVLPGEEEPVRMWTPQQGFTLVGNLRFAPEPDTDWADLEKNPEQHPLSYFRNAAFFSEASRELGDDLSEYVNGLVIASAMKPVNRDRLYGGRGCVPHACGYKDSILIVDFESPDVWFAQITEKEVLHWPSLNDWSEPARNALQGLE